MKTTIPHIFLFILLFCLPVQVVLGACELYNIDFINNQLSGPTYNASCAYNVTPSQWEVRNDTCVLSTTPVVVPGSGMVSTPVSVRINRSGNLDCDDWFKIEYSIDGVWYTQDSIAACDMSSAVQNFNFNVVCGAMSVLGVRVTFSDNGGPAEKWFVKDGDICISTPVTLMPVEITTFSAQLKDRSVKVAWTTVSESNNDFFSVERSGDGINFETIKVVDGKGNSRYPVNYTASDDNPLYGTAYYRLKQTDFNGLCQYSKVISLKYDISLSDGVRIFPNPCEGGYFKLTLSGCKDQEVLVVLYDAMGNQVYSKVILKKDDAFYTAIDPNQKLNPGIYMVVGSSQEQVFFNHRLIVR